MLVFFRFVLFGLGAFFLVQLTFALFTGQITYSVGDVDDTQVVTKSFLEAFAIWLTFGTLCMGLIIAGAKPHLYKEKPWLWKVLGALIFGGYVLANLLRS